MEFSRLLCPIVLSACSESTAVDAGPNPTDGGMDSGRDADPFDGDPVRPPDGGECALVGAMCEFGVDSGVAWCCPGSHCTTRYSDGGMRSIGCRECAALGDDCSDAARYGVGLSGRCCGAAICREQFGDGGVAVYECPAQPTPDAG